MKRTIKTYYSDPQDYINNLEESFQCESCYLNVRELHADAKRVDDISDLFEQTIDGKDIEKIVDGNKIGFTLIETIENG